MGQKAADTSELFFTDVKVPKENLLGEEGMGFLYLMQELPQERLSIATSAVAATEAALAMTVEYVKGRNAFGKRIADFQHTQFALAQLDAEVTAMRAFIDRCAELHLTKQLTAVDASKAKLLATELQCKVVDECVQLHGGYGYLKDYPLERIVRDLRVHQILEGTNEIMRVIIAKQLTA